MAAISLNVPKRQNRIPLAIMILLAGFVIAIAAYFLNQPKDDSLDLLDENLPMAYGPEDFDSALQRRDEAMALNNERVARGPDQWAYQEALAIASLARAQLTGDSKDFLISSNAIATAMKLAPAGGGPAMTDAIINLSLHRYPQAERDLEDLRGVAVPLTTDDQAEMKAIEGDIAFYGGDYKGAMAHYQQAETLDQGARTLFRLGNWHKYAGDFDSAIAIYRRGAANAKQRTPQMLAVYLLQIGALELQRGQWDTAHRYFARANDIFPGYWLAEAHVAQMLAVEGDLKQAEQMYKAIISRTQNPDVMMALSGLYAHLGDVRQAEYWSSQAGILLDQRVKQLPAAYYDHAFDHAITVGDNEAALTLAKANYAARAYGDSAIALARAYIVNGQSQRAVKILTEVNASGWVSVEQHLALAHAYEELGKDQLARREQQAALKINPKALDPNAGLLSFGNH